ncbi:hypothetical protein Ancab_026321 [Ancistrocladus abbreviatus]
MEISGLWMGHSLYQWNAVDIVEEEIYGPICFMYHSFGCFKLRQGCTNYIAHRVNWNPCKVKKLKCWKHDEEWALEINVKFQVPAFEVERQGRAGQLTKAKFRTLQPASGSEVGLLSGEGSSYCYGYGMFLRLSPFSAVHQFLRRRNGQRDYALYPLSIIQHAAAPF